MLLRIHWRQFSYFEEKEAQGGLFSSAKDEYKAMRKLTNELIWLKALLKDLGIESPYPITMHCDNQAAINIASNLV